MNHIVLGYDGSDFSVQALDWALDEAELRKLPLTVAHAWQWPYGEADEEATIYNVKAAAPHNSQPDQCCTSSGSVGAAQDSCRGGAQSCAKGPCRVSISPMTSRRAWVTRR
ncbi:MAG TPA: universal stress protein [Nonomuraea sp.]|nr:universal stress protein [Nonomuraea sp.]